MKIVRDMDLKAEGDGGVAWSEMGRTMKYVRSRLVVYIRAMLRTEGGKACRTGLKNAKICKADSVEPSVTFPFDVPPEITPANLDSTN